MKRELALALDSQSHPTDLLGRTRASKSRSIERLPASTENECKSNRSIDQQISQDNALDEKFKNSIPGSESVVAEESKGEKQEDTKEVESKAQIKEESAVVVVKNDLAVESPRRFTRSELKRKGSELAESNLALEVVAEGNGEGVAASVRTRAKKIKLQRPTTIKELLMSGLLEGCPVFYNAGKKGIALRGLVEDNGILCSCSLCKCSRVVTASQFELHACNSYRHAAKFICLENGKNLLEVLDACKYSSLETLEETIQSVIGSFPAKESIICQNCKGKLCHCIDPLKSQDSPTNTFCADWCKMSTNTIGAKARSSERVVVLKSSTSVKVCMSSRKNKQGKIKRKSSKPSLTPASTRSASQEKSRGKTAPKSPRSALVPKSPGSVPTRILSQNKSKEKMLKKVSKSVLHSSSSKSDAKKRLKITKKDQRMHWLVFEEDGLPDGTEVAYYSHGKKLLEGYKKGAGIFCLCCNSEVSPSLFEAHAGLASRKKPYGNIYTSNGVSLHELAISLLKGRKYSAEDNDDLCIICADGGNLLLCDGCPRSFHKECASLSSIPRGKWYCTYCQNMFQRERFVKHNANAVAAGRVSGVDPIEDITKRCIRVVKNPEKAEVIACVLCRGDDINKSGFGPSTVILCDQCEKEYHVGCLKKNKMADLKELPKGKWFCCMDCKRIFLALQNLLKCGAEKLPDSHFDIIKKKLQDKGVDSVTDLDVRWRLMSGKIASSETRLLLSEAVALFHDCFDPIVDSATGRDFIPSMVYGRSIKEHDFGGMYCAILTVNSSIVSAGMLRVFGRGMAELPLVATANENQGKGYFQLLFSCIEKLLAFLNVTKLVLPAADEAGSIWTDRFGFKSISPAQLSEYRKDFGQMMTFQGTSMLEKAVPQCRIIR